ncbi:MAG: hypothetical protein PHG07_09055 [Lachnospiraceae bacterium]|nr:hypothetical protein [Lachnospiraceae bacterium]
MGRKWSIVQLEDDVYKDIIRSSTTTNKKYDQIAGVNGKGVKQ